MGPSMTAFCREFTTDRYNVAAGLFALETLSVTDPGAVIVETCCRIPIVWATMTRGDFGDSRTPVNCGAFRFSGRGKGARRIDDTRQRRRGNASAANDEPGRKAIVRAIEHPDTGVWVSIKRNVWRIAG